MLLARRLVTLSVAFVLLSALISAAQLNKGNGDVAKKALKPTHRQPLGKPQTQGAHVEVKRKDEISSPVGFNIRSDGSELSCCNCAKDSKGCYHPNDVKRSRLIRCCQKDNEQALAQAASTAKKGDVDVALSSAEESELAALSPADQELMKRHQSKIRNLVVANKRASPGQPTVGEINSNLKTRKQKLQMQKLESQLEKLRSIARAKKEAQEDGSLANHVRANDKRAKNNGDAISSLLASIARRGGSTRR